MTQTDLIQLQASIAFVIETSHFICIRNQVTSFYMKYSNRLK